jgi:hypothetical protein
MLAADRLDPKYIDLPLEEITKAIDLVATRSNLGRVVLRAQLSFGQASSETATEY